MSLDNSNPCKANLDIFYNILRSMNDVYEAIKLIKACERENEFRNNNDITMLFCNYYREDIMNMSYNEVIDLFSRNRKVFYPLFNNVSFWIGKIKHDILSQNNYPSEDINNINFIIQDFFLDACKKYPIYAWIIINHWNINLEYMKNLPLFYAISGGNINIIKLLLDKGIDHNKYPKTISNVMKKKNNINTIEWIIEDGRINIPNDAIVISAEYGNLELIKLFLDKTTINPEYNNNEAIRKASENGHDKIVKFLLLDKRVDPTAQDNEAIRKASENGHDKIVKLLLLDKRVDPTAQDNEAIISAVENKHIRIINILLNDERVAESIEIDILLDLTQSKKVRNAIWNIIERHNNIHNILKRISDKKEKLIFKYWKKIIEKSNDESNTEIISINFNTKQRKNIIHVKLSTNKKLEEFSEIYRQQIRGYLLVNNKEMIVIFQSLPKSDVSIVHIKI